MDVAGWWTPGGEFQLLCGTVSARTLKLTFYPDRTTYAGTFSSDVLITGTETDSGGTGKHA